MARKKKQKMRPVFCLFFRTFRFEKKRGEGIQGAEMEIMGWKKKGGEKKKQDKRALDENLGQKNTFS